MNPQYITYLSSTFKDGRIAGCQGYAHTANPYTYLECADYADEWFIGWTQGHE